MIILLGLLGLIPAGSFAARDTLAVAFTSEGHTLRGDLLVPRTRTAKMPAIIFLVGSGPVSSHRGNYQEFLRYFLEEPFADEQVALLYFDKRGVWASDGKWHKTDFEQRAYDAAQAARYLRSLSFIDSSRIYLVGHSQGGWITQICLADYPELFAGGVSMAGATFGVRRQIINDYQSEYICEKQLPPARALRRAQRRLPRDLTFISLFPVTQNWKQLKRIKRFEPQPYLQRNRRPLLLMAADNDELVSADWCEEELRVLYPAGLPDHLQWYRAAGENHSFKIAPFCYSGKWSELAYSELSRQRMIDWLHEQFNRP